MGVICRLTTILLLCSVAFFSSAAQSTAESLSLKLEAGYRLDDLDWNIDGGALGPNIISELEWENLEIYQLRGEGRLVRGEEAAPLAFCMKGFLSYGWITDGESQDSDFAGDDRTLEFSRSNNNSDDGYVFDVSAGIGPRFRVTDNLVLTPLLGFSYHEQNLTMTDGVQTLSRPDIDPAPPVGPFPGLDSTFETQWYGPWAGIDLEWKIAERVGLYGSFEYHWVDFEAEADWNLREDFAHPKSFEQQASDGEGIVIAFGGKYELADRWSVHLMLDYQEWQARDGKIHFFPATGGIVTQGLNEVNWESWAANLGVTYRFL